MIFILNIIFSVIINDRIDKINQLTSSAENAFINKDYKTSIENYRQLIDSLDYYNEKVYLNLAHAYLLSNDTLNAIENYNFASLTDDQKVKSIALQQLGNINEKKSKLEEALSFYKQSIISDNDNDDAKFNYELVKKKIQQNQQKNNQEKNDKENSEKNEKQNSSDNKNQDQEGQKDEMKNKENEKNEEKNEEGENKNNEETVEERLKKINMSKKKAEMILDALNNNEFQYIQQLKRQPTKKTDKTKPDW